MLIGLFGSGGAHAHADADADADAGDVAVKCIKCLRQGASEYPSYLQ